MRHGYQARVVHRRLGVEHVQVDGLWLRKVKGSLHSRVQEEAVDIR